MKPLSPQASKLSSLPAVLLKPDTRLRGRSRFGAAKARHLFEASSKKQSEDGLYRI
jgi:hypothetical protein